MSIGPVRTVRPVLALLAALVLAPTAACLDGDDAPVPADGARPAGFPAILVTEYTSAAVRPPHAPAPPLPSSVDRLDAPPTDGVTPRPDEVTDAACACTDQSCVDAWVEATFGCGLCVHVRCDATHAIGGCVACPAEPAP